MNEKEFILYRGDELITIGTKQELADFLEVDLETVIYYCTPSYRNRQEKHKPNKRKRMVFVEVEEDDEDEMEDDID